MDVLSTAGGYDNSVLKDSPEVTIYQDRRKYIGAKGRNSTKKLVVALCKSWLKVTEASRTRLIESNADDRTPKQ